MFAWTDNRAISSTRRSLTKKEVLVLSRARSTRRLFEKRHAVLSKRLTVASKDSAHLSSQRDRRAEYLLRELRFVGEPSRSLLNCPRRVGVPFRARQDYVAFFPGSLAGGKYKLRVPRTRPASSSGKMGSHWRAPVHQVYCSVLFVGGARLFT